MKRLRLPFKRIDCVSLDSLFTETIEPAVLRDCSKYNLSSVDHGDIIKLIHHHFILHTCNTVLSNLTNDKIVFYTWSKFHHDREGPLVHYLGTDVYQRTISKCLSSLQKNLPLRVYTGEKTFDYFTFLHSKHSPTVRSELAVMSELEPAVKDMSKIRKYVKRLNLTFLNESYINSIQTKLLLAV